ncbi:MAG: hypothetical protein QW735_02145 [archaeon]
MIKLGIYSLTCDEGCLVYFLEFLNSRYSEFFKKYEIADSKSLGKNSEKVDVALVEGCISTEEELEKIKEIRKKCKFLVALGSCACSGSPSNWRNFFNQTQLDKISSHIKKYKYLEKSLNLKAVVEVDFEVPGCPFLDSKLLDVFKRLEEKICQK